MAVGRRSAPSKITAAERRVKALHLRKAGATYRDIGATLKVSEKTAFQDVRRALEDLAVEQRAGAEALRALEAARLDALQLAYWPKAVGGDVEAAKLVLRLLERRARLFGLDAQPDATLPTNTVIILRWSDGNVIDATPVGDHPAAALPEPAADCDAPGALPYRVRWETLGQEPASGDAEPQDRP